MVAAFDQARRERKEAQREALERELRRLAIIDKPVAALEVCCKEFTHDYLTAVGLHKHNRTWRKKRGAKQMKNETTDLLINKAQAGDRNALAELDSPAHKDSERLARLKQGAGDLTQCAIEAQIDLVHREDLVAKLGLQQEATRMTNELMGEHPTQLEQVLIGQVISSWVGVSIGCMMSAITVQSGGGPDNPLAKAWEKRYDRALTRFHRASQELARTGKLLRRPDISNTIQLIDKQMNLQ